MMEEQENQTAEESLLDKLEKLRSNSTLNEISLNNHEPCLKKPSLISPTSSNNDITSDPIKHHMEKVPSSASSTSEEPSTSSKASKSKSLSNNLKKRSVTSSPSSRIVEPTLPKKNDILVAIEISKWDNIVGPQCVYLWTEEMTSSFYPSNLSPRLSRLVKYVKDHTVDHHDVEGNSVNSSTLRSTICIVKDLNLAYMSVSIRVPPETPSQNHHHHRSSSLVPHAVSVLSNLSQLEHFLSLRPLILNWLAEFAPKIGVLLCNNQLQSSKINSWCAELCKTMNALKNSWWPEQSETKGGDYTTSRNHTLHSTDSFINDWDFLSPRMLNKSALESILTSHLSTSNSSIVVGLDYETVNLVIRFLLCFLKEQEGYCSRYSLPFLPDTYMKGLFVQGLLLGHIGERSLSFNHIISNKHPYTHIEVGSRSCRVGHIPISLHKKYRRVILLQELAALWNSTHFISPHIDPFPNHNEGAPFVSKFIEEMHMLPPEKRYLRLLLFRRMLHSKAIVLLTYIQSIRSKTLEDRKKRLKKDPMIILGCSNPTEYHIIQVTAEKIRPGTIYFLENGAPLIKTLANNNKK